MRPLKPGSFPATPVRWWVLGGALLAVLGVPGAARAIVIAGATKAADYRESTMTPISLESFNGVGHFKGGVGLCSGVLINPQQVLFAAHCLYGPDGVGNQVNPTHFILPEFAKQEFAIAYVVRHPDYKPALGHRVPLKPAPGDTRERFDLAVATLVNPIAGAKTYAPNTGQIPDERDPKLTTVKVGFGNRGNGEDGAIPRNPFAPPPKRYMLNRVDQYGDGMTRWHPFTDDPNKRDGPPPKNTLVYDFDDPDHGHQGTTVLTNFHDEDLRGAVPPVTINDMKIEFEGSPAGGDSGGPMFQRANVDSPWVVVGITSSGSTRSSKFGTVAFDTRVSAYQDFIQAVTVPEPSSYVLLSIGTFVVLTYHWRRRRDGSNGSPCSPPATGTT